MTTRLVGPYVIRLWRTSDACYRCTDRAETSDVSDDVRQSERASAARPERRLRFTAHTRTRCCVIRDEAIDERLHQSGVADRRSHRAARHCTTFDEQLGESQAASPIPVRTGRRRAAPSILERAESAARDERMRLRGPAKDRHVVSCAKSVRASALAAPLRPLARNCPREQATIVCTASSKARARGASRPSQAILLGCNSRRTYERSPSAMDRSSAGTPPACAVVPTRRVPLRSPTSVGAA